MPTPRLRATDASVQEALRIWNGLPEPRRIKDVAKALGVPYSNAERRLKVGWEAERLDPAVRAAQEAIGTNLPLGTTWGKTHKDGSITWSVSIKPEAEQGRDFRDLVRETIEEVCSDYTLNLPKRFDIQTGNLLVLDPADVHIGKLSVASETGYAYDSDIAEHRLVEGCRILMERGMKQGVTRVLFIIGNDIAHIDSPKRTTTSGTPQDTHGSIFTIYKVAQRAYVRIVRMALEMGLHIDLMFNPSNHDWVLGFTIAQAVGLLFADHPNVGTSDYYISERHRKYYRFEKNLIGATHGDGAKVGDLSDIMRVEARSHISDCPHLYWMMHHYHHRIRKNVGVRPMEREKDHIGMTIVQSGAGRQEGDDCDIMYVRSPSPPDSWHDRNGFINRQAVEAFIHHPFDGRTDTLTTWF